MNKQTNNIAIFAEYNRFGFEVVATRGLKVLEQYRNGNTDYDDYVPIDHPYAQPLRVIKQHCMDTAEEMAQEWQGKVMSIDRVKDDEL